MNEVEQFYLSSSTKQPNTPKSTSAIKDKNKDRHVPSFKKLQLDASRREAAAAKRMQDLMRQFGSIFRQVITKFSCLLMNELLSCCLLCDY